MTYKCHKCNKSFPDNWNLKRHMNCKTDCLTRTVYNSYLLNKIVIRDKCIIENIPEKLKSNTIIDYTCKCGNNHSKQFIRMNKFLAVCYDCSEKNRQRKRKQTCLEKYGYESHNAVKEIQEKRKQTCLKKYGTEHYTQTENAKKRFKKTCLEKYGCENPSQAQEIKQKKEDKSMEKYGTKNISQADVIKQKKEEKSMEKYGTKCVLQAQEIKNKTVAWSLNKYGTIHPSQNADYAENHGKKTRSWKEYTFPCGTIVKYQGYENWAYDELINDGYGINDFETSKKKVPVIWYTVNGKKHRYYVDIYIPSINKMIEVKSTWTYEKKEDNVKSKANECVKQGYDYEIWIYDAKKNKKIINTFK